MQLSGLEMRILSEVKKDRWYTPEEAEEETGMSRDAIVRGVYSLREKGLVELDEMERISYELTEEGKEVVENGLPEERVYRFIEEKGEVNIREISKKFSDEVARISLGWLKRKNSIEIRDGKVIPIRYPGTEEIDGLKKVMSGESLNNELFAVLKKRGFIEERKAKELRFRITADVELEKEDLIGDLNPSILLKKSWKGKKFLGYDARIPSFVIYGGKIHPYQRIIKEVRKIFLEMGFTEIKGEYVQTAFWNFDALFQPQDHPARDMQDTFYLREKVEIPRDIALRVGEVHETGGMTGSTGWGGKWDIETAKQLVLRTHTTALTIHYLAMNPEPPVKAFCIDRVYRRESIDATHLPEFDQIEGVVMARNVGFVHLLGTLKEFYMRMGFEVRFRPGFFPYTEPSVEAEVYVPELGWIELGGAGVFRKEVTEPLGIKHRVLAWGLGLGRLAMLKLGLKDLRALYQPDIHWLREVPVCLW